jgi:agmatine/peptidylarginine deiminase
MKNELKNFRTEKNKAYKLIDLPWPSAKYNNENERLPATYANYLIINNFVLVPTYQDKQDNHALIQIQKAYPEHKIVGIDCLALINQFGSLHCISMQLPCGFLSTQNKELEHEK